MKVAITGARGFIGRHLVHEARRRGHDVTALVRPGHDATELAADGAEVVRHDLGAPNGTDLAAALAGVDAVIHAAARVAGPPAAHRRDTIEATREVADASRRAGVRRLVHVSTTAVYGDRAVEHGPIDESAPYGDRLSRWDDYAHAKIAAEGIAREAAEHGLEVALVRPGWVFGERDRSTEGLLGLLRLPVSPVVGSGENRLPLTYVGSVVEACLSAARLELAAPVRAFNVACDWEVTQRELLAALAAAAGLEPRYLHVPFSLFHAAGFAAEAVARVVPGFDPPLSRTVVALLGCDAVFVTDRARDELGWSPRVPFDVAVERTVRSITGRAAP